MHGSNSFQAFNRLYHLSSLSRDSYSYLHNEDAQVVIE